MVFPWPTNLHHDLQKLHISYHGTDASLQRFHSSMILSPFLLAMITSSISQWSDNYQWDHLISLNPSNLMPFFILFSINIPSISHGSSTYFPFHSITKHYNYYYELQWLLHYWSTTNLPFICNHQLVTIKHLAIHHSRIG